MKSIKLECKKFYHDSQLPIKKRDTDVGYDVYAYRDYIIQPKTYENIDTGIALSCPPGWYYTIEGRSGMFKKGIVAFRGIIDSTYTGRLFAGLYNLNTHSYFIKKGDRVAQIILHKQFNIDVIEIEEFSPEYKQRGEAGWGASGR